MAKVLIVGSVCGPEFEISAVYSDDHRADADRLLKRLKETSEAEEYGLNYELQEHELNPDPDTVEL